MVEKPAPEEAPSDLAIIGRYILDPMIMETLDKGKKGAGGEIQITDAMADLIGTCPLHGLRFKVHDMIAVIRRASLPLI